MKDNLNVPEFHPVPVTKSVPPAERTWKEVTLDGWEKACPWVLAMMGAALIMGMYILEY